MSQMFGSSCFRWVPCAWIMAGRVRLMHSEVLGRFEIPVMDLRGCRIAMDVSFYDHTCIFANDSNTIVLCDATFMTLTSTFVHHADCTYRFVRYYYEY